MARSGGAATPAGDYARHDGASGQRVGPMKSTKPPFRADHVGSLLRPAPLKEARAKHAKGKLGAAALKAIEDREIEKVVKKQEEIGLQLATDGEFRRSWWQFDFYKGLEGVELYTTGKASSSPASRPRPRACAWSARSASPAIRISITSGSEGPHARHAEDDDPGAEHAALPAGPPVDQQARSIRTSTPISTTSPRPTGRRSARSTTPAAAICRWTTPPGR